LQAAHIAEIVAARIEPGEVDENTAALSLACSVAGANLVIVATVTGRCNLISGCAGVFVIDPAVVDRVNMVDKAITLATLAPFCRVAEGEMTATVKIIPYAVSAAALEQARAIAAGGPLRVAPFHPFRVGVVSTLLPELKASIVTKTLPADPLASTLRRIESVCDLIVIFGACAITDRRDVVPSAVEKAGGRIEHFGMPVEPGNLLLLDKPVIGAPGCARSPNGFDFVLDRILAGLSVRSGNIRRMGVGGLLVENTIRSYPGIVPPGQRP
jgi:molybdenum cofactor cytidylyltransferase